VRPRFFAASKKLSLACLAFDDSLRGRQFAQKFKLADRDLHNPSSSRSGHFNRHSRITSDSFPSQSLHSTSEQGVLKARLSSNVRAKENPRAGGLGKPTRGIFVLAVLLNISVLSSGRKYSVDWSSTAVANSGLVSRLPLASRFPEAQSVELFR
jgi:hypothetical protein